MSRSRRRKRNKKVNVAVWVVLAILCIGGIIGGVAAAKYQEKKEAVEAVAADRIWNNIYIDEVNVSGMNKEEAIAAVDKYVASFQAESANLLADSEKIEATMGDLGFAIENVETLVDEAIAYGKDGTVQERYDLLMELEDSQKVYDVVFVVDKAKIQSVVESQVDALASTAKDASIVREGGEFVITDEVIGQKLDVDASVKAIETYYNEKWEKGSKQTIDLVLEVAVPDITREKLEQIQNVLGSYTTYCGGTGSGRVQNIITGAGHINGALIMPGEEFSANAAMEPYTYDNGYAEAGAYENGKVVQSMGGGICQVSSTLFNAALLAEVEITERMGHSMLVDYVEPSMDAAIAGTYKDLKIKNSFDAPIYIEGYVSDGYITFTIYGKETRSENREIEYISETLSVTAKEKEFEASGDDLGTMTRLDGGHTGLKAQLWKVVTVDGEEESREVIYTTSYMMSEEVWSVGTASDNKEASALVKAAIKTQDEDEIAAAIAEAKQIIKEEEEKKAQEEAAKEEAAKEEAAEETTEESTEESAEETAENPADESAAETEE